MNQNMWMIVLMMSVVILLLILLTVIFYFGRREQRLLARIQNMLDAAIAGTFTEKHFNESRISAVENSMWRFLCDSKTSYNNVADEKAKMQTLISDISHQTAIPITNIMLYSQLMEENLVNCDLAENAELMEELKAVCEETRKLDFLVQSLVKLSRLENGIIKVHTKEQNVALLLQAVQKQFQAKAEEKEITFWTEQANAVAVFDWKWTLEALGNIVENAMKYTPAGGSVTVKVECYSMFVRIHVQDTGIGVAEEEQACIFTRFYRSSEVSEQNGVGIGLYLAREIIKAQDGYIKVESEQGMGSDFSIFLPCGKCLKNEIIEKPL